MNSIDVKKYEDLVPVQIIGTQRSGSNLLRLMLNQVGEVFAPHPPHILKTFFPILKIYGDLSEEVNFNQLVRDVCEFVQVNTVPWQDSILDPDFIHSQCRENTLLEVYRKIYEVNAILKQKKIWVNKSMLNVYYIDLFEKNGLHPLLIHLVRDGRDVSLSFKRTIIGEKHIYHLARQWKNDQEMSDYYIEKYGPSRALRVKYEDLLRDPSSEIRRICTFLNVSYTRKIFQYYTSDESLLTAKSGKMWINLSKPIIKNNYNKYKSGLSGSDIEIFELIASRLLTKYGYHVENDRHSRGSDFSKDEIDKFNSINEHLKQEILKTASPAELQRRIKQEKLIRSIKERTRIY